jgi:hypothetical protein
LLFSLHELGILSRPKQGIREYPYHHTYEHAKEAKTSLPELKVMVSLENKGKCTKEQIDYSQ